MRALPIPLLVPRRVGDAGVLVEPAAGATDKGHDHDMCRVGAAFVIFMITAIALVRISKRGAR